MPSKRDYDREFLEEAVFEYPDLDRFEDGAGFKIGRVRLQSAARVLACPIKVNPPCWQHGRLIYAMARRYLETWSTGPEPYRCALDIGTAKGFSALMLQYAVNDAHQVLPVFSVDVINPRDRVLRNTVAEVDAPGGEPLTLSEILAPYPEAKKIAFVQSTGEAWLKNYVGRVCFAFVDGKHSYKAVSEELALLADLQNEGDILVIDDMQIDGVKTAVAENSAAYTWDTIPAVAVLGDAKINPRPRAARAYAIARHR